jgi:hypothetical protein
VQFECVRAEEYRERTRATGQSHIGARYTGEDVDMHAAGRRTTRRESSVRDWRRRRRRRSDSSTTTTTNYSGGTGGIRAVGLVHLGGTGSLLCGMDAPRLRLTRAYTQMLSRGAGDGRTQRSARDVVNKSSLLNVGARAHSVKVNQR